MRLFQRREPEPDPFVEEDGIDERVERYNREMEEREERRRTMFGERPWPDYSHGPVTDAHRVNPWRQLTIAVNRVLAEYGR